MDIGNQVLESYVYDDRRQEEVEEETDVRKGPWAEEEDATLAHYISIHGEGRWNIVARSAGLRRTGKSCRLRWLNYLRPDVRRGNITLQEQLLILELHSRWGNRWSKIAQYLPGRTDNEIKNYWRTRVQKQAKQLKCDVNSKQFRDAMRYVWMPRIMERIRASEAEPAVMDQSTTYISTSDNNQIAFSPPSGQAQGLHTNNPGLEWVDPSFMPELSGSSSGLTDCHPQSQTASGYSSDGMQSGSGLNPDAGCWNWCEQSNGILGDDGESLESLWNDENIWFLHQQFM